MNRLIILAALLLSVVGGLTLMSSSSPLAAQTGPSATRSFEPVSATPDGTVTVHIDVEGVGNGVVTEMVPTDFTYVSTTALSLHDSSDVSAGKLVFTFTGNADFTYTLTAPSAEGTYEPFSGELDPGDITVGGPTSLEVSTTPAPTGPKVTTNNLDFDVVPSKAVKGARVSGVGNPIATNPLEWVVEDTDMTLDFPDAGVVRR